MIRRNSGDTIFIFVRTGASTDELSKVSLEYGELTTTHGVDTIL